MTPGSGPGHLSLFGYDPIKYLIPRGALSAAGIDFPLQKSDVAARANFATIDDEGNITDRRAGRIPTELCAELAALLEEKVSIPDVKVFVKPERDHRAVVVFRGTDLSQNLHDTDPQEVGVPPLAPKPVSTDVKAKRAAEVVSAFLEQVREILKGKQPANMMLLRGFAHPPDIPGMNELYGIKCAAIAVYPMYRGLARLVGMEALDTGDKIEDEFETAVAHKGKYDYFFVHVKPTDSRGEDGDFDAKVAVIEEIDQAIPKLLEFAPDVLVVTGDHSTPARWAAHSWHPVPFILKSEYCRVDAVTEFSENACARGNMGRLPATALLSLMLANANRLAKFGA